MLQRDNISDQELISLCIQGRDAGYTGLYKRYSRGIYNSIARIVSHTAEAEDILQETFFAVFSNQDQLKVIKSFEGWVRRLAINRAISHLRKRKIVFADMGDTELEAAAEYDVEADEVFNSRVDDVRHCISELSEGYRTIINLYLFEKMTHDDIATMLGIRATTVRTQYHRAKKRILVSLKDKAYYE